MARIRLIRNMRARPRATDPKDKEKQRVSHCQGIGLSVLS
jgi:hypothetical protein